MKRINVRCNHSNGTKKRIIELKDVKNKNKNINYHHHHLRNPTKKQRKYSFNINKQTARKLNQSV